MLYNNVPVDRYRLNVCRAAWLMLLFFIQAFTTSAQKTTHGNLLLAADSLFQLQQWQPAKEKYQQYLSDTVTNPVTWSRFGFCNYQLGLYQQSISNYDKALMLEPLPPLKSVIELRLARSYSQLKKEREAMQWLDKAVQSGYKDISEVDKLKDFDAYRALPSFQAVYKKIYTNAYPCSADPKHREFDFWVGEWDVFQNGTTQLVGHSLVEKISGECALLENWTAGRGGGTGKSLNYFDPQNNSWEQDWIGSMGGAQRYLNGMYKDSAMRFTYETVSNGKKIIGNFIFYNMGPGKVRQYQDASQDGGKTFTVSYDFIYIRRK